MRDLGTSSTGGYPDPAATVMADNPLPCAEKRDRQGSDRMPCIYAHLASPGNTELLSWRARTTVVEANPGEFASLVGSAA